MYSISITIASHPDRIQSEKEEAERKAKHKAEKARIKAQEKAKQEKELNELVDKEYTEVEAMVHGSDKEITDPLLGSPDKDRSKKHSRDSEEDLDLDLLDTSRTKKLKAVTSLSDLSLKAPIQKLLSKADSMHNCNIMKIKQQISIQKESEKTRLINQLNQKMQIEEDKLIKEAIVYRDTIKTTLEKLSSASKTTNKKGANGIASQMNAAAIAQ